jgi:hypothetical protein
LENPEDTAKDHFEVEPAPADLDPELITPPDNAEPGAEGIKSTPSAYQLRPQGLRPVRRQLRRHGLRNDCPPDRRRPPRSPSSRTRLR